MPCPGLEDFTPPSVVLLLKCYSYERSVYCRCCILAATIMASNPALVSLCPGRSGCTFSGSSNPDFSPLADRTVAEPRPITLQIITNGNREGHSGYVIRNMQSVSQPDLPLCLNIVLIYVRTNDMLYPVDLANAPQRTGALV